MVIVIDRHYCNDFIYYIDLSGLYVYRCDEFTCKDNFSCDCLRDFCCRSICGDAGREDDWILQMQKLRGKIYSNLPILYHGSAYAYNQKIKMPMLRNKKLVQKSFIRRMRAA